MIETEELDKKYKSFNVEYKKKDALIREQKKLIDERNKFIKTLEERVKSLEKRCEMEVSSSEGQVKQLKMQVDSQAAQIANLTFQLHQLSKSRNMSMASELVSNSNLDLSTNRSSKPKKKPDSLSDLASSFNASRNQTQQNLFQKISNKSTTSTHRRHRRLSAISVDSISKNEAVENDDLLSPSQNNTQQNLIALDITVLEQPAGFLARSMSAISGDGGDPAMSRSNSVLSNRSISSPRYLPPPAINKSDIIPPPDPQPFLQAAPSKLHSRSSKDSTKSTQQTRRTLISLPPIKQAPYEINQLAVECPHKSLMPSNENSNASN